MSGSEYRVNHFVSEFLVKPWKCERKSNSGIWYYDFSRDKIDHKSSKIIFAERRVFTPEIEKRYDRLIETPLSRFINSLTTEKEKFENSDWEIQRALYLIFLAQAARVSQAREPKQETCFSEFLKREDDVLNGLVSFTMQDSQLIRMPSIQPIFYPDLGIFQIPFEDSGCVSKWSVGYGIPITPHIALVMLSKTAGQPIASKTPLWAYSLGLNERTNRVAIPPYLIENDSQEKIIEEIKVGRSQSQEIFRSIDMEKELFESMINAQGLILEKIPSSFHRKFSAVIPPDFRKVN